MPIRPADPSDAAPFCDLVARNLHLVAVDPSGTGTEAFRSQTSEQAFRRYLASPRYGYLTAQDNGRIVGFIGLRDRSHVMHLFVDPAYQRTGLGRQLWEAARSRDALPSYTVNSSLNAQGFYQALGFQVAGPAREAYGVAYIPMMLVAPGEA